MTIKNIIIVIVVVVAVGVGYLALSNKDNKSKKTNTKENKETVVEINGQDGLVFNGEGKKIIGPVALKSGLVIVRAKNQSGVNSSFSVNVYKDDNENGTFESGEGYTGTNISVGYEDAEAFNGSIPLKSKGGNYFVEVEGGRWQITFDVPEKLTENAEEPSSFSGKSINVTKKFYLPEGEYSFHITNKGGGNLFVYLVDENGNSTKRLVNELYDFEGDFVVDNIFSGNYVFAVTGGDWTITKNN
jgi:hypothetical protein